MILFLPLLLSLVGAAEFSSQALMLRSTIFAEFEQGLIDLGAFPLGDSLLNLLDCPQCIQAVLASFTGNPLNYQRLRPFSVDKAPDLKPLLPFLTNAVRPIKVPPSLLLAGSDASEKVRLPPITTPDFELDGQFREAVRRWGLVPVLLHLKLGGVSGGDHLPENPVSDLEAGQIEAYQRAWRGTEVAALWSRVWNYYGWIDTINGISPHWSDDIQDWILRTLELSNERLFAVPSVCVYNAHTISILPTLVSLQPFQLKGPVLLGKLDRFDRDWKCVQMHLGGGSEVVASWFSLILTPVIKDEEDAFRAFTPAQQAIVKQLLLDRHHPAKWNVPKISNWLRRRHLLQDHVDNVLQVVIRSCLRYMRPVLAVAGKESGSPRLDDSLMLGASHHGPTQPMSSSHQAQSSKNLSNSQNLNQTTRSKHLQRSKTTAAATSQAVQPPTLQLATSPPTTPALPPSAAAKILQLGIDIVAAVLNNGWSDQFKASLDSILIDPRWFRSAFKFSDYCPDWIAIMYHWLRKEEKIEISAAWRSCRERRDYRSLLAILLDPTLIKEELYAKTISLAQGHLWFFLAAAMGALHPDMVPYRMGFSNIHHFEFGKQIAEMHRLCGTERWAYLAELMAAHFPKHASLVGPKGWPVLAFEETPSLQTYLLDGLLPEHTCQLPRRFVRWQEIAWLQEKMLKGSNEEPTAFSPHSFPALTFNALESNLSNLLQWPWYSLCSHRLNLDWPSLIEENMAMVEEALALRGSLLFGSLKAGVGDEARILLKQHQWKYPHLRQAIDQLFE